MKRRQIPHPRSSRLSLQTKLAQVVEQRDAYLEALETIADILEDAGILDSAEEEEEAREGEEGIDQSDSENNVEEILKPTSEAEPTPASQKPPPPQ